MRSRAARRAIGLVIGVGLVVPIHRLSEGFWLTTVPEFVGSLVVVAMFAAPWFLLRRWLLGRIAMIAFTALLAFGALEAIANPSKYPDGDGPGWVHLLPLVAVLALMRRDRKRREAATTSPPQEAEEAIPA